MLSRKLKELVASNGGRGYSPDQVEDLMYWYDASQETTFVDGSRPEVITDFSGNGRNLTRATEANRSTFKTNIVNGQPVFRFSGSNNYFCENGNTDINWMHQSDTTIFWVVRSNIDNAVHCLFDSGAGSSANIGRTTQFQGANIARFTDQVYAGGGVTVFANTPPDNSTPKDTWLVIMSRFEQAKASEESTIEVNNVLKGTANQTGTPSAGASVQTTRWFSRSNNLSLFNGDFAQGFGYNRALTDDEIRLLVGGVNSSYGL